MAGAGVGNEPVLGICEERKPEALLRTRYIYIYISSHKQHANLGSRDFGQAKQRGGLLVILRMDKILHHFESMVEMDFVHPQYFLRKLNFLGRGDGHDSCGSQSPPS